MNNEDKTYGVRISFDFGNPISLDLGGAGKFYIKPGKDYFFENAPIEFINYLAQLKGFGVSYKITTDKKGCFDVKDLRDFNTLPKIDVLGSFRAPSTLQTQIKEQPKITKEVKATEEDIIKVEPVKVEDKSEPEVTEEPVQEEVLEPEVIEETKEEPVEEITEESELEPIAEPEDEPQEGIHVYTEDELKDLTKKDLLTIAADLDLPVSDINTKKEIREAILNKYK